MKFKATLWKVQKDSEGEAKIILLIPQVEANEAMNIPTGVVLDVEITPEA